MRRHWKALAIAALSTIFLIPPVEAGVEDAIVAAQKVIHQCFHGSVDMSGATTGQVPMRQSDGTWKPGTVSVSTPTWGSTLAATNGNKTNGHSPLISTGDGISFGDGSTPQANAITFGSGLPWPPGNYGDINSPPDRDLEIASSSTNSAIDIFAWTDTNGTNTYFGSYMELDPGVVGAHHGGRWSAQSGGVGGPGGSAGSAIYCTSGDDTGHNGEFWVEINNSNVFKVTGPGSIVLNGRGATIAQNATDGFTYLPVCSTGAPSGTPTSVTGAAPVVVGGDNHFYAYLGGGWIKLDSLTLSDVLTNGATTGLNNLLVNAGHKIAGVAELTLESTTGNPINFSVSNTTIWDFSSSGHFLAATDATYDIGANGANRPRNGYFSGTITLGTALGATSGGTGQSSWTTGDMLYASGSNTLAKRAIGNTGDVLTVSGGVPTWAAPSSSATVFTTRTKSADFNATDGAGSFYIVDASGANRTATLPAANSLTNGQTLSFKKIDSSGNTLTIARAGSDTIDDATSKTLTVQYGSVTLVSDGSSKWYILQ